MELNEVVRQNIRSLRIKRGLSQEELASLSNIDRAFVSSIEVGDGNTTVSTLEKIAKALDVKPEVLLVADYANTQAGKWGLNLETLSKIINDSPSLRGFLLGYLAERKAREDIGRMLDIDPDEMRKPDDHDRTKKGDISFTYHEKTYVVEVKCLQTNSVKGNKTDGYTGVYQCDASDCRDVLLPNGNSVHTTSLSVGEFDIVAVGLFAFGDEWAFAYAKNDELQKAGGRRSKISPEDRKYLLKTTQTITLPLQAPYTHDIKELLP